MRSRVVSALSAGVLGGLSSIVLLAVFYLLSSPLRIDFAVDPPRLLAGVYPAERDHATGLTFAWTSADLALRLPGLDRRVAWVAEWRLRGGRENAADNPAVAFFVDGIPVASHQSTKDFSTVTVIVPARPERPRGVLITAQTSTTFTPGPADPRALGVMLDAITLRPEGFALPPPDAFYGAAAAGAAMPAGVALLGVTPGSAIGAAIVLAAGQTAVVSKGFGALTRFPQTAARASIVIAVVLVVFVAAVERARATPFRNTARFALAFSAAALLLKLLVLLHPDMPVGDAVFQAHRFQDVIAGNYYFTSMAPGNYLFPYAPGLYVIARPFARFVRGELGNVALLRVVVLTADAVMAALLYLMVVRSWRDRRAAAVATAVYQLLPLDFLIAAGGTLTSAFAQSTAILSLGIVSAHWLRFENMRAVAALTLALLVPFLSHTSTFAILSVTALVISVVFAWRGGPAMRSPAGAVAAAATVSVVLAVAVYYAHFLDTYRTEFTRISSETAAAAADAGGRSIGQRAGMVPYYVNEYFAVPAVVLAAGGAAYLWRRGARDRLTLAVAGWGAACLLFLVIGILTPVDMRYYLAALPVIALLASAGASSGWAAGGRIRVVTSAVLAWTVWVGVRTWWQTLG